MFIEGLAIRHRPIRPVAGVSKTCYMFGVTSRFTMVRGLAELLNRINGTATVRILKKET
jgi:hypothetical protein